MRQRSGQHIMTFVSHRLRWWFCIIAAWATVYASAGQEDTARFYFDYRIEITYKAPSVDNGQVIALYNSMDKYVAYTKIYPVSNEEDIYIVFQDGSQLAFRGGGDIKYAELYAEPPLQMNPHFDVSALADDRRTVVDIAGYEAISYTGELTDGTARRLWLCDDAFDSSPMHYALTAKPHLLPLSLTEISGLDSNTFVMGNDIQVNDMVTHSHRVSYLEYELNTIETPYRLPQHYLQSDHDAVQHLLNGGKLYIQRKKNWDNWHKMHGLDYEPMTYEFDRKMTYSIAQDLEVEHIVEVFYNTYYHYAGILIDSDTSSLYFILAFKNGTAIAYYEGVADGKGSEAIFFQPAGDYLHFDHPETIKSAQTAFERQWTHNQSHKPNHHSYQSAKTDIEDTLHIEEVDLDLRMVFTDFGRYIPDFPLSNAMSIPLLSNQLPLNVRHHGSHIKLLKHNTDHQSQFSDETIDTFRKVVRH